MDIIKIKNLLIRTIIGINEWERVHKQDVIINIQIGYDAKKSSKSDDIKDTVNYKDICKRTINITENSKYNLIETLSGAILDMIMENEKVLTAIVEIDKPQALRFSESVSVTMERVR